MDWFVGRTSGFAAGAALFGAVAQHRLADDVATELEQQVRQLGDRPSSLSELLARWSEQSQFDELAFALRIQDAEHTAHCGDSQPVLLTFREVLLRSRAFELLLDTCAQKPALAASLRRGDATSTPAVPLLRALDAVAEQLLVPGARDFWPALLEALLAGSVDAAAAPPPSAASGLSERLLAAARTKPLRWEKWARSLLRLIKRGWQCEALPGLLRQLDGRMTDLAAGRATDPTLAGDDPGSAADAPGNTGGLQKAFAGRLSKHGIRAAFAREKFQRQSGDALRLRTHVELLCTTCEQIRSAEEGGSARAPKIERLLADTDDALAVIDSGATELSDEHENLSRTLNDIGMELQNQITGVMLTQSSVSEKQVALRAEREDLLARLKDIDSEIDHLGKAASNCLVQVQQLREQLRATSAYYEEKIKATHRAQKEVSAEKFRAVACKECAQMALDSVQVDARRRSAETSELMQRSCRDLRRALVKYVRAERCRLELAGICAAAADDDAVASPGGFAATAAEAWEAAQILLQRAEALAGDWWGQADDEAVRVAPSSHEDEHFGDRRDFTASNLAKGQCCADCGDQDAEWASVSYGIFLCTECAGRHRGLGVHRSFVRSATMDKWTARQLRCMKLGGNSRFTEFMSTYPRLVGAGPLSQGELELRYSSQAAAFYRSRLEAECDGREPSHPPPPPLVGHQPDDGAGPASPPMPSSDGHRATEDWSADDEDSGSLEVERERLVEAYAEWCRRVSAPALGPGPGEGKDEY